MIYGYYRVSTRGQLIEGYSLEAQAEEIRSRYENVNIIHEQYTGTTTDQRVFNEPIDILNPDDTLVVSKLDRLARNTIEGIQNFCDRLMSYELSRVTARSE